MSKQTKSLIDIVDSRHIDILIGVEEKKSKFQHYASIFSFVKNTKLKLYESIMQNLIENYLVIKFNTTHTQTQYMLQTKRYVKDSMFN